jgi:hypothetical protein
MEYDARIVVRGLDANEIPIRGSNPQGLIGHKVRGLPQAPEKQKADEVVKPFRVPEVAVETNPWLLNFSIRGVSSS